MAVQQNRSTRSKIGMRRSHDKLLIPKLSVDKNSGEIHVRHHITKNHFYKGLKQKIKNGNFMKKS